MEAGRYCIIFLNVLQVFGQDLAQRPIIIKIKIASYLTSMSSIFTK